MNFPNRDRKYLLKITLSQCETHLLYMLILNPSRHSCEHANQNLTRATPSSIRNISPVDFFYHTKCFYDTLFFQEPVTVVKEFNDGDVAQIFIDKLEKNIIDIYKKFKFPKSMIMTMHDKLVYDNSTLCHICNEELCVDRVRDHCHLSGKFRGTAHEVCSLKYKVPKFFPIVFHNLSGYDTHLFIKTLGNSEGDISGIPNNEENYISFTKQVIVDKFFNKEGKEVNVKHELRFINNLRFMASNLDKLSSNLKIDQFVNLNKYCSGNQLRLLLSKDVYPYDYVDCMKKLDGTSRPPKDAFYSKLTGEGITDEDYQHAHTVWKEFNIESMKDYHKLCNL